MYRIISIPLQELVNEINECARTAAEEAAAEASAAPNLGEERVVSSIIYLLSLGSTTSV